MCVLYCSCCLLFALVFCVNAWALCDVKQPPVEAISTRGFTRILFNTPLHFWTVTIAFKSSNGAVFTLVCKFVGKHITYRTNDTIPNHTMLMGLSRFM